MKSTCPKGGTGDGSKPEERKRASCSRAERVVENTKRSPRLSARNLIVSLLADGECLFEFQISKGMRKKRVLEGLGRVFFSRWWMDSNQIFSYIKAKL